MCEDHEDMPKMDVMEDGRECDNEYKCLENARVICDGDPKCFGISWQKNKIAQKIEKCLSRKIKPAETDGWRTIMKSTNGKLIIKEYFYMILNAKIFHYALP